MSFPRARRVVLACTPNAREWHRRFVHLPVALTVNKRNLVYPHGELLTGFAPVTRSAAVRVLSVDLLMGTAVEQQPVAR
ncbi:MAG: hypothetical protein LC644_02935 [Pseudonocardia sp.]|nr:hypothetical protein [Pseudonocardia sp.]